MGGGCIFGYSFNLAKIMVLFNDPYRTRTQSENAKELQVGHHAAEDPKQIRTSSTRIIHTAYQISPRELLGS